MIPEAILEGDDTTRSVREPGPAVLEAQLPVATRERGIDVILVGAVMALVAIGTIEVYSASAVYAARAKGSATYFLIRHLVYLGAGLVGMAVCARKDFSWLHRLKVPLLAGSFLLLGAVLFVGTDRNEARRWLSIGPLSFQPVEVAKLGLVVTLAASLARKPDRVRTFTVGFLPHLLLCGAMMALVLKQPDLGSSMILGATTLILLFVAGTRLSYILLAVLAAAPIVYSVIVGTPWRMRRMIAFLDPWQFREDVGYQIVESLISIGSGGLWGLGLGDGMQKLFYMPEAHNDFIMSSIGEELGFVGFAAVLFLYAVVLWRGVAAALSARDAFGTYLAFGLTSMMLLQALVNSAVVLGAIPAKGLTLPFVSYGGTSLIMSLVFVGIILNIAGRAPPPVARSQLRNVIPLNRRRRRRVVVRVA